LIKELQIFVKERIAPYKYPRAIRFVSHLPQTPTGKIKRFVLRDGEPIELVSTESDLP
jgi:acyl-coenzyme A synthetase/AMP-(fatty) acid ligase